MTAETFSSWAIVELMGHRTRAGLASEIEIAGGKMLRIEIPIATDGEAVAATELYSIGAIYSLRPCTEDVARAMAARYGDPRPISPISHRPRPLIDHDSDAAEDDGVEWSGCDA